MSQETVEDVMKDVARADPVPVPKPKAKKKAAPRKRKRAPKKTMPQRIVAVFGKRMRARRQYLKLSMEALAKRCRCSMSYISMLERGQREPTIAAKLALARGLKTDPNVLFKLSVE